MTNDESVQLRLVAQRALLGQIPRSLRAVSVDIVGNQVRFRCLFDGEPTEADREILSVAATEIIADFKAPLTIDEEFLAAPFPEPMNHLRFLVYLRHESANA